ncbi:beta-N-acetylhexosaminidase [Rossellomorea sp. DA94]|uniref:beta-N-acetylhexosaminidase n=1 Tax=Rossellomorea sp. DA94 TaxID=3038653 RepID=UPI002449C4B8|nr:beta-N-acetylhexosaminidase [Rossellomorea sp. DA94]WGG46605.1 beta-N-acetylhexosaminidase [Rossellomorea sp. DA94]
MIKRIFFIIFLGMSLTLLSYIVFNKHLSPGQSSDHRTQSDINSPNQTVQSADSHTTQKESIHNVISNAKEGRVPHISIVSGQTRMEDVTEMWGNPDHSVQIQNDTYNDFIRHGVTIGVSENTVYDVRSFDPGIQEIHLNQVKGFSGPPDEVKYYQDKTHDQIILIYNVNSLYQLKWIFPKATPDNPNPKLDHISVLALDKAILDQEGGIHVDDHDASKILSQMSLEDKIGQMVIAGVSGSTFSQSTKNLIQTYKIGGFIFFSNNMTDAPQTVQFLNRIKSVNRNNPLPLFLSTDQEGGRVTRLPGGLINFPSNEEIGKLNSPGYSYEEGVLLGRELKEFGFNLDFAPVLDVNSNPNNPVIGDRSYSSDPEIVSHLGIQTMEGIQSQGIISTVKHFPGHGDTDVDSHLELPIVNKDLDSLEELELLPFQQAIKNEVDLVMVAHILLPKLDRSYPSSMSESIITDLLRRKMDYHGVVITDDMTMKAITDHYGIGKAAVQSVKAGCDLILVAHDENKAIEAINSMKEAVRSGEITENQINESVKRIIHLKQQYHLADLQTDEPNISKLNESITELNSGRPN